MSIGKRVYEAIERMDRDDPEGAFFAICATIEPTARRTTGKGGRESCKTFIDQNLGLITRIAFGGGRILNINIAFRPPMVKESGDGTYSMGTIVYHAIRCALYHECELPASLRISATAGLSLQNGVLTLPGSLVYGILMAVVTAPCNAAERTPAPSYLAIRGRQHSLDDLWGDCARLENLLDAANDDPEATYLGGAGA